MPGGSLLLYRFPGTCRLSLTPGPGYLDPSGNLPAGKDDYSFWDVLYTPYGNPNYPDLAAPFGIYRTASAAGFTPPANSSPINPSAYWDSRNPTITQTGTPTAFIIGPGTQGKSIAFARAHKLST